MTNQKIFITKYALTSGVIEIEAEIKESPNFKKGISAYGSLSNNQYKTGFFNDDFHLIKEEALMDCEKRRKKKIESLKKQILKLEKLSF